MRKTERIVNSPVERAQLIEFIKNLEHGKPWLITIQHYRKQRSLTQNALWHKWFTIIAEDTGDTMEGVKSDLTQMFTPMVESKFKPGEMRHKTTSELTTAEGAEFQDRIYQLAASFNIWLRHPDDQGR